MRLGFLFVGSTSATRLLGRTFDLGLSKCLGNMMLTQIGRSGTKKLRMYMVEETKREVPPKNVA